jgi:hypothetical protein
MHRKAESAEGYGSWRPTCANEETKEILERNSTKRCSALQVVVMGSDQPLFICTLRPIPFPSVCHSELTPTNKQDNAACSHSAEIQQRCRDTSMALQELRHGIANALFETLSKRNFDWDVLVQLLDERPTVVQQLLQGDTQDQTTEKLIEYLEKLNDPTTRA